MIKPTTRIYFDAIGIIDYKLEDYRPEEKSKNNPDYTYARFTFYLKTNKGKHRISLMGGFLPTTKIYGFDQDKNQCVINFANRFDKEELEKLSDDSFKTINFPKDSNKESIKLLSDFDFIREIPEHIKGGEKVRIRGEMSFNEYQDEIQKNFTVKSISILDDIKDYPMEFKLNFSALLDKNSFSNEFTEVEQHMVETKLSTYFYVKKGAEKKEVYKYPIYFRCKTSDIGMAKKECKKYFSTDKVIKIGFVGTLFNGKIMENVETPTEYSSATMHMLNSGIISIEHFNQEEERSRFGSLTYIEKIYADSIKFNFNEQKLDIDDQMYTEEDLIVDKKEPIKKDNKVANTTSKETFFDDDDDDVLPF